LTPPAKLDENPGMGGTGIAIDRREAASALRWWLECGVDIAIQDAPRNWFERSLSPPPAEDAPAPPAPPQTLDAFREWFASAAGPLASRGSKPIMPSGAEGAEVMLLCEPPTRDELAAGEPIGGAAAELMQRMLQSIGMAGQAYSANLACFHSPGPRLSNAQLEQCAEAARKHIALARPKRLLLLGDLPSRALLGKPLLQARGHVHRIEGVRTVATFHPRQLLKRPSDKALAWKDLLLLTEDAV
jgi:DNA polymerase